MNNAGVTCRLGKFCLNIRYIELELVKYNTPCASGEFLVLLSFLNREASCLSVADLEI